MRFERGGWLTVSGDALLDNSDDSPPKRDDADRENDTLTFNTTTHPVYLNGRYKVLLDLDDVPQLGDLNNGEIDLQVVNE